MSFPLNFACFRPQKNANTRRISQIIRVIFLFAKFPPSRTNKLFIYLYNNKSIIRRNTSAYGTIAFRGNYRIHIFADISSSTSSSASATSLVFVNRALSGPFTIYLATHRPFRRKKFKPKLVNKLD